MIVFLLACIPSSELNLTLFVEDTALDQATFPAIAVVDFAGGQELLGVHICDYDDQDFLETDLDPEIYKGCRSATTVRGVLIPYTGSCENGLIERLEEELPPTADWFGLGETIVFDSDSCGVEQTATLLIEGL